uniref:Phosphatidylethanolamine N-methyltransferase n=1 Tax=Neobodo designis TaxID=312471 RepID=A0A6U4U2F6_NEODS|mmetsp:Transcript_39100/g.120840  ORF Transcript_39100/g.120840 Transcript_39100/m.120840 type:complete len:201 (+) Transcript_39100:48-650(+)
MLEKVTDVRAVCIAAGAIAASPTIWNIIAQNEHKNGTMTRLFGDKYRGAYALAAWIFTSSLYRDHLYSQAVLANPDATIVAPGSDAATALKAAGVASLGFGMTLVLSSMYKLGVTGTYLGDYFGIFLPARVTSFPFDRFENPMYLGSTASFLGIALQSNSLVGVGLSAWVWAVYRVATGYFEGPYTDKIYADRAKQQAAQ